MNTREHGESPQDQIKKLRTCINDAVEKKPSLADDEKLGAIFEDLDFAEQHLENQDDSGAETCLKDASELAEELGITAD